MAPPPIRPRNSSGPASREARAFVALFKAFGAGSGSASPVRRIEDLKDGRAFMDVLAIIDPEYFSAKKLPPTRSALSSTGSSSSSSTGEWVSNFNTLKRLHQLLVKYAAENLPQSQSLETPNLQAIARTESVPDILAYCRVVIAVGAQAMPGNELLVSKIQGLGQTEQTAIMVALEPYLSGSAGTPDALTSPFLSREASSSSDGAERARLTEEKQNLEAAYHELAEETSALRSQLDETTSERDAALAEVRQAASASSADDHLRSEIDRLRDELRKSEDNLGEAEQALDSQTRTLESLTRRVEEQNLAAAQVTKLKDQLDELRHAADRLQKSENANKKLSKKLEESTEARRQLKTLEDENASLVDRNAAMEDESRKASTLKSLVESYKAQIAEFESRDRAKSKELAELSFASDQLQEKVSTLQVEVGSLQGELHLNQERVRELELGASGVLPRSHAKVGGQDDEPTSPTEDLDADLTQGTMGGEIDDALTGTTKTDLKLQVRKLQRDLAAAQSDKASSSRILVLENLLEDSKRMKDRYEQDYLEAHKSTLVLQSKLDDIADGKTFAEGPETLIALRMRLVESVEELDVAKRALAELQVKSEATSRELVVAKSDLTLVSKDQIDILHSLRESVNADKIELETELLKSKKALTASETTSNLRMGQINDLLMEKVNLQGQSIGAREKMLERERAFGDLRVSLAGRDLPEDVKARIIDLQDEKTAAEAQMKALSVQLDANKAKLHEAKRFIKDQDALFRSQAKAAMSAEAGGNFEEAQRSYEGLIAMKDEEIKTLKSQMLELHREYKKGYEHLHSTYRDLARKVGPGSHAPRSELQPVSWLAKQRKQMNAGLRR